jgi:hypothetical protein
VYQVDALIKRKNNMLIKSTTLKVIITTLALSSAVSAFAGEVKFKLAVIEDTAGIQETNVITFNKKMSQCAAFAQTNKAIESEVACTDAIRSVQVLNGHSSTVNYLKSLSYSNRGISRYLHDDISGAEDDFIAAILIDSNVITKSNLKLLKQSSLVTSSMDTSEFSD